MEAKPASVVNQEAFHSLLKAAKGVSNGFYTEATYYTECMYCGTYWNKGDGEYHAENCSIAVLRAAIIEAERCSLIPVEVEKAKLSS